MEASSKAERAREAVERCAKWLHDLCDDDGDIGEAFAQVAVPVLVGMLSCTQQEAAGVSHVYLQRQYPSFVIEESS